MPNYRKETNRIIVHHSLSHDVSAETIAEWHKERGFYTIGYHYVIRTDGSIEEGRGREEIGAHAKGRNADSIGICLTGDFRNAKPTRDQYAALRDLIRTLRRIYGHMPIEAHRGGKNPCPGKGFCMMTLDLLLGL